MRCTSIEKYDCSKRLNQKLTYYCIGLILNLLHADVVHLTFGERVGLLGRTSIAISILRFRTFSRIMSNLLALKASDLAQVPLGWGRWVGAVLSVASCSIPVSILGTIVVVETPSIVNMASMVMMGMSSRVRGKMRLLLSSRVILPLSILPFAALYLLFFPSIIRALSTNSW